VLLKLTNQAQDYAWGSKTLISDYFGLPATGKEMAEIWFGTHHMSPTKIVGSDQTLAEVTGEPLPYLLKILAADAPLSIQAHPNQEQAIMGFAEENSLGIPLDSPARNYKDALAKPEMLVALSESFEVLVGFADSRVISERFQELLEVGASKQVSQTLETWLGWLESEDGIEKTFLSTFGVTQEIVAEIVDLAEQCPALVDLVSFLNAHHNNDPGVVSALMLNHVKLNKGEAVFVPAGMPHAYLSGLGIEVMLASDNVLRGGLTQKHIDLKELTKVLVFEATEVSPVSRIKLAEGLARFQIPVTEFDFYDVKLGEGNLLADLNLPGAGILLCTAGSLLISNSLGESETLKLGEAAYVSADARLFSLSGSGEGYLVLSSKKS
jgi:mannose-6-phosphate isomerase